MMPTRVLALRNFRLLPIEGRASGVIGIGFPILCLQAIRQAFSKLRLQGIPVTPVRLGGLELLPQWLLAGDCQCALRTCCADLIAARRATAAREKMAAVFKQLRRASAPSRVPCSSRRRSD